MWLNLGQSREWDSWELLNPGPHFNRHKSLIWNHDCLIHFVLQSKQRNNCSFRHHFLQWRNKWNQREDMQKSLIHILDLKNSLSKPWWVTKNNQKANDNSYFYLRWKTRSKFCMSLRCGVLFIALEISYQLKASPEVHREARPSFSAFH